MEEVILKEREVREKIVDVINTSGLPAIILKPIIKEVYEQLINVETQQYEHAKIYKQKINEEKEEKEVKEKK